METETIRRDIEKKFELIKADIEFDEKAERDRTEIIKDEIYSREKSLRKRREKFDKVVENIILTNELKEHEIALYASQNYDSRLHSKLKNSNSDVPLWFGDFVEGGGRFIDSLQNDPAYQVINGLHKRRYELENRNEQVHEGKHHIGPGWATVEFGTFAGETVQNILSDLEYGHVLPRDSNNSIIHRKLGRLTKLLLNRQMSEPIYTSIVDGTNVDIVYIREKLDEAEEIILGTENEIASNKANKLQKEATKGRLYLLSIKNRARISPLRIAINNNRLINRLQSILKDEGITQGAFAKSIGYSSASFSNWRNNKNDIGYSVLVAMAEQLKKIPLKVTLDNAQIYLGLDNNLKYSFERPAGLERLLNASQLRFDTASRLGLDVNYLEQMVKDGGGLTTKVLEKILEPIREKTEYLADF